MITEVLKKPAENGLISVARPRLLIVDDEDYIRDALSRFFELRGFEVDQARDGLEAVEKCAGHIYDLVTMDLEMPNMGGREAIDRIRRVHPALPIIVLTGYSQILDDRPIPGISGVLTKPVSLWKIDEEIRKLIPPHAADAPQTQR